MRTKRVEKAKTAPPPADAPQTPQAPVDAGAILAEIGGLYRDRLRAHYNNDLAALEQINQKIEALKAKL